jgi:serine phosphatase RsbU (regulator of sigma subunit)
MRVLVGWDDTAELELVVNFLEAADWTVQAVQRPEAMVEAYGRGGFDAVLFAITLPNAERSFAAFRQMLEMNGRVPMLAAARPGEVYALSRFIRHGVQAHVWRDPAGEWLILLQTILETALAARRAEELRALAEKLRAEIESVRQLQESIIPCDMPQWPGYALAARYEPSQIEVSDGRPVVLAGGDYYDVFQIGKRLVFLVGDASGHGIKACMAIVSMHVLIHQLQEAARLSPAEFISQVNERLCRQNLVLNDEGFITLFYGVVEGDCLHWASAGHCLPLLQDLRTGHISELGASEDGGGLPLAITPDAEYTTLVHPLPPLHRLIVYTDGLVEALPGDDASRQFGLQGVKRTLDACRQASPEQTLDALFHDSQAFTAAGRHDDTSVLIVERQ